MLLFARWVWWHLDTPRHQTSFNRDTDTDQHLLMCITEVWAHTFQVVSCRVAVKRGRQATSFSLNTTFKLQILMPFSCREEKSPHSHSKLQVGIMSSVVGKSTVKTGQDKSGQAGSLARSVTDTTLCDCSLRGGWRRAHASRNERSLNPSWSLYLHSSLLRVGNGCTGDGRED